MPILNYTTQISSDRTIAEIQKILVKHGATKIVTDYQNNIPVAVTFGLFIDGKLLAFSLPCNYYGVFSAMKKGNVPRSLLTEEQALRVSWRIIKDWIEAQMAIVEARLADIAEVFLPYAVTKNGTTLYKNIKENGMLLLAAGE